MTIALIALAGAPAVLAWWAFTSDEAVSGLDPVSEPLSAPVVAVRHDESVPVIVDIATIAGATIRAPSLTGTVTDVLLQPGRSVDEGEVLLEVDGVDRIAFGGAKPFYRDLQVGDSGDDVRALQRFLGRLGLMSESDADGEFGPTTRSAVVALGDGLGVVPRSTAFSIEWVVWIPNPPLIVAVVGVQRGQQLLGASADLFATPREIDRVTFTPAISGDVLDLDPNIEWVLDIPDADLLLSVDSSRREVMKEELADLPVAYSELGDGLRGFIRRRNPVLTVAVPPTGVVNDSGSLCVWHEPQPGSGLESFRPVIIELVQGGLGRTLVLGDRAGGSVLANPAEMGIAGCT